MEWRGRKGRDGVKGEGRKKKGKERGRDIWESCSPDPLFLKFMDS